MIIMGLFLGSLFPGFPVQWNYSAGFQVIIEKQSTFNDVTAFKGMYLGYFGNSPIEIALEMVGENGAVTGYSLHKGLKRPLNGTWAILDGTSKVKFILNEPGDNKFDGHFDLMIDAETFEGGGTWVPKQGSGLGEVAVVLKKKT
jgi:hypothetical protein